MYVCDHCNKQFTKKKDYDNHRKMNECNVPEKCIYHANLDQNYECGVCHKMFTYKNNFYVHYKKFHKNGNEQLRDPGSKYIYLEGDDKPYQCVICKIKYVHATNFYKHFRKTHGKTKNVTEENEIKETNDDSSDDNSTKTNDDSSDSNDIESKEESSNKGSIETNNKLKDLQEKYDELYKNFCIHEKTNKILQQKYDNLIKKCNYTHNDNRQQIINAPTNQIINQTNIEKQTNVSVRLVEAYGKQNAYGIDIKDVIASISRGSSAQKELLCRIHFNVAYPHYKNIYVENENEPYVTLFDGKQWSQHKLNNILPDMYKNFSELLIKTFHSYFASFSKHDQITFGDYLEKYQHEDTIKENFRALTKTLHNRHFGIVRRVDNYVKNIDNVIESSDQESSQESSNDSSSLKMEAKTQKNVFPKKDTRKLNVKTTSKKCKQIKLNYNFIDSD